MPSVSEFLDEPQARSASEFLDEEPEVTVTQSEGGDGFLAKVNAALRKPSPTWLQAPEQATRELVTGMVPHDIPSYLESIYPPAAAARLGANLAQGDVSGLPLVGRVPEIMAAEDTPAGSKERYLAAMKTLMDVGMLAGAGERAPIPLRGEPLVPEPPPTQSMGPGTIAGDVSRALERRFTLQEPPPEQPPDIAPSVPIEQTLPNIGQPPIFNPELGPQPQVDFQMPLRTETANMRAERILNKRQELLNRQKDLKQRFINGEDVGPELEAVEAKINDRATNPVVHPPPKAQEAPVQTSGGPAIASEPPSGVPVAEPAQIPERFRLVGSRGRGTHTPTSDYDIVTELTPQEYQHWVTTPEGEYPRLPKEVTDAAHAGHDVFIQVGDRAWKVEPHPVDAGQVVVERVSQNEKSILSGAEKPAVEIPEADRPYAGEQPTPGIANRVLEEQIKAGTLPEEALVAGKGTTPEIATARARDAVAKDPNVAFEAARRVHRNEMHPDDPAILHAYNDQLAEGAAQAAKAAIENPGNLPLKAVADAAEQAHMDFLQNVLPKAKGQAQRTLVGFQGATPPNYATYAGMLKELGDFNGGKGLTNAQRMQLYKRGLKGERLKAQTDAGLDKMQKTMDRTMPKTKTPDPMEMRSMMEDFVEKVTPCE